MCEIKAGSCGSEGKLCSLLFSCLQLGMLYILHKAGPALVCYKTRRAVLSESKPSCVCRLGWFSVPVCCTVLKSCTSVCGIQGRLKADINTGAHAKAHISA